jgi:hypothetical protein
MKYLSSSFDHVLFLNRSSCLMGRTDAVSDVLSLTLSLSAHGTVIPDHVKQALIRLNESMSDESCSFYMDVEKLIPCGDDGYTLHFAHHYCQVYLQHRNEFVNQQQRHPSCERAILYYCVFN